MPAAVLVAAFMAGHTLVHAGFVSPRPTTTGGPAWPFMLDRSWLLTRLGLEARVLRAIGVALVLLVVVGYATAVGAILGFVGGAAFGVGVTLGSSASLVLLGLFFHPWLIVGVVLDLALLLAVIGAGWTWEPLP